MPKDVEDISPDRLREEISSDAPEVELKLVTGARHKDLASGPNLISQLCLGRGGMTRSASCGSLNFKRNSPNK